MTSQSTARRGFTLTELLVVIGIIAVLVTLTTISVRGIARDARLSSAKNSVLAALDNARGLAMKENTLVMLVFRPRMSGRNEMTVELVLMQWTGETFRNPGASGYPTIDRFVPVEGIKTRQLPEGIKVGAPRYGEGLDGTWATQPHLPSIDPANPLGAPNEFPGALIAITYAPDGTVVTRNSATDSHRSWADFQPQFDDNGNPAFVWRVDSADIDNPGQWLFPGIDDFSSGSLDVLPFDCYIETDECYVTAAPFLVIFDDDEAREEKTLDWTTEANVVTELTGSGGYINRSSDRIHFNRYTGVAMK